MYLEVVGGPEGSVLYRVLCSLGPFPVTFKRFSGAGNSRVAYRRPPNFHFRFLRLGSPLSRDMVDPAPSHQVLVDAFERKMRRRAGQGTAWWQCQLVHRGDLGKPNPHAEPGRSQVQIS